MSATHDIIATLVDSEATRERNLVADWLARIDFAALQNGYLAQRHSGTNDWFLDESCFSQWQVDVGANLLCHGAPGSGKSVLAATVVDYLRSQCSHEVKAIVIYYYCDYSRPDVQQCHQILATLVRQLIQEQPALLEVVKRCYRQHKDRFTRPSEDDIYALFETLAAGYRTVFLVVDALDELPSAFERTKLLKRLDQLQQRAENNINLFLTSRDIPEIIKRFPEEVMIKIRAQDQDVEKYLKARLPELESHDPNNVQLQNDVVQRILHVSDGMYEMPFAHSNRF